LWGTKKETEVKKRNGFRDDGHGRFFGERKGVFGVCGLLLYIGIVAYGNPTQPWLHSWKICPV